MMTVEILSKWVQGLTWDYRSAHVTDGVGRVVIYNTKDNLYKQFLEYKEQLEIFQGKKKVCL